ncbi:MAG: ABC transporter permease [Dehalococcoidia bacterium]|jgi:peptide/nickel transport system permease protein|nr:ABC transporter permease [Dehalococcoidia bacterium]
MNTPVIKTLIGFLRILYTYPILPVIVVVVVVTCALFAPFLARHDPLVGRLQNQDRPPIWGDVSVISGKSSSPEFILGTDALGRDILSRIIWGARYSMIIAGLVLVAGAIGGTILGTVAGFFGGIPDEMLMRLVDLTLGLPFILVALATVVVFGNSMTLIIILLILFSWPGFARQVRAETIRLRAMDFVAFAVIAGASPVRIILKHILPGVVNTILVIVSLNVGQLILTEASLSFLGVGIPKPTPAWGSMVAEGREYISTSYWMSLFPGLAIFAVVFAMNFLGDWLRDRLDPRLRQL